MITNSQIQEILMTTYSGKIISMQEKQNAKMQALISQIPNEKMQKLTLQQAKSEKQDKISTLQKEVELLKKKAKQMEAIKEQELDDLQEDDGNIQQNNVYDQNQVVDYGEPFKVDYKLNLIAAEASYSLLIDSQLAIDTILQKVKTTNLQKLVSLILQSMQNIDIISTKDNICTITKIDDKVHQNVLLATLKIQGEETKHSRVEIKIRTSEGQNGHLNAIVMPKPYTGNKTAQFLDIPLKPLNLHERIDSIEESILNELPLSVIKLTGKFSITDAYNWVSNCLPDVPHNHNL